MSDARASTPGARVRPVERFLGPTEIAGGPFALLNLAPADCNDGAVLDALESQLERVNSHPQCDTPEADEVRLALHAAAAQLLDPVVRRHLIARWTGAAPPRRPALAQQPPEPLPRPGPRLATAAGPTVAMRLLEHDAILTLGVLGWNQRSLRRLASLAHARGLNNQQVAVALRSLSRSRSRNGGKKTGAVLRIPAGPAPLAPADALDLRMPAPPAPHARPAPRVAPADEPERVGFPEDPASAVLKRAVILGGGGLLLLVAIGVSIVVLTQPPGTPPAPPGPGAPAPTAGTPPPDAPTGESQPPRVEIPPAPPPRPRPTPPPATGDLSALGRDLAAAAAAVQFDPQGALPRFETAVETFAAGWPTLPRDRLISAQDSIVEFIYRAGGDSEVCLRAVAAVASPARAAATSPVSPEQVVPAIWSGGMLLRLARETDIPASARQAIESALTAAIGPHRPAGEQTFEAGAAAMAQALPQRLLPAVNAELAPGAWERWAEATEAAAFGEDAARLRLLLAGLETLLVYGPEPNQSRATAAVIGDLVGRATWRAGDDSRRWLLRWFGDRRISAADLYAVTSALATRSSAEGVDITMVLSTASSDRVRAELRDRYATVWGIQDQVARDDLTEAWTRAAREAIDRSLSAANDMEQLEQAALLARINEAAWWQWRGEGGQAAAIVANLRAPIDAALAGPPNPRTAIELMQTDGGWGEKYLAARGNAKARRELLEQMRSVSIDLGPVDAEIIAGEAAGGGATEVRTLALELVRRFATNPAMINAVLERLPKLPRTPATATLVEAVGLRPLPPLRDADWPIAARRSLIERLLEVEASEGPMATADRLAKVIAVSYRAMASTGPLAPDERLQSVQPAAHLSAGQLWGMWRAAAGRIVPIGPAPIPLDEVERLRAGRLGLARGLVQAFAAEQASLCELMGYVIGSEKPGRVEDVRAVLARLAEDRRRAASILDQLRAAERSMTQLWLIRLAPAPEEPPA